MSLLSEAFEPFVFVTKSLIPDGEGGMVSVWTDGKDEFPAIANVPNSTMATVANALTERVNCTITTSRAITLEAMDVIKRLSDGRYFRITSSGTDYKTPNSATIDMRQSSAELWNLPTT